MSGSSALSLSGRLSATSATASAMSIVTRPPGISSACVAPGVTLKAVGIGLQRKLLRNKRGSECGEGERLPGFSQTIL